MEKSWTPSLRCTRVITYALEHHMTVFVVRFTHLRARTFTFSPHPPRDFNGLSAIHNQIHLGTASWKFTACSIPRAPRGACGVGSPITSVPELELGVHFLG